ncbi:MAG: uracil-DNA glycosylase [Chitinophagaceae bacterium]
MVQLEKSWLSVLQDEFEKDYMKQLKNFLLSEKEAGQTIYPPSNQIFAALDFTPFDNVKVVVIGQDPYHGPSQAHGLSFSVNKGIDIPPSLRNIYKELVSDIGISMPSHGYLKHWADQGVLLLNATLTVRANEAGSHQKKGWEVFTDEIIRQLSERRKDLVFLLWGNFAKSKKTLINGHKILEAAHPSPLSAHNGFFNCKHFSQTNAFLVEKGMSPIDWQIV